MQRSNPLLLYLSVHSALQTALSKRKLLSRTELVSAEGFNRGTQRAKLQLARKNYVVEQEERLCLTTQYPVYVLWVATYSWHVALGTTLRT